MKLTKDTVIAVVDGNYGVSLDECVPKIQKQILENQEKLEKIAERVEFMNLSPSKMALREILEAKGSSN